MHDLLDRTDLRHAPLVIVDPLDVARSDKARLLVVFNMRRGLREYHRHLVLLR